MSVWLLTRWPAVCVAVCVLPAADGKSTLADSLVSKGGFLNKDKAGSACVLDNNEQEKERGITIYSTGISLEFAAPCFGTTPEPVAHPGPKFADEPAPHAFVEADARPVDSVHESEDVDVGDSLAHLATQLHLGNLPFRRIPEVTEAEVAAALCTVGINPWYVGLRTVSVWKGDMGGG